MKVSDFQVVGWKFTKFLMSFLEVRGNFSSNFAPPFNVMKKNYPVFFHWIHYVLWTKGSNQSVDFQTFDCSHEINEIAYVIFQATCQFSFKFYIIFPCHPLKLSNWNIYTFFFIFIFFHEHSQFTAQQGKGVAISLTPL